MVRKRGEHTRKRYGPTGGWAMRMSQRGIVPNLGRTSGPGRSTMRLLESHAIPGVMLCGLSIVHEEIITDNKRKERSSERTSGIVTVHFPTPVRASTEPTPSPFYFYFYFLKTFLDLSRGLAVRICPTAVALCSHAVLGLALTHR